MKRNSNETVPDFEGRSAKSDWIAADLGACYTQKIIHSFNLTNTNILCVFVFILYDAKTNTS